WWRRHHFGEGTEFGDQLLGQRLDVALRNGTKQNKFQKLIVADGIRPSFAETRPQPLAVAVVMRRCLGETRLTRASLAFCFHELARRLRGNCSSRRADRRGRL